MDKRTVIAYILIIAVIFLMPVYYNLFVPSSESPVNVSDTVSVAPDTAGTPETQSEEPATPAPAAPSELQAAEQPAPASSIPAGELDTLVIETSQYWITLSNQGGGTIQSIRLKHYFGPNGEEYAELIPPDQRHVLTVSTTGFEAQTINYVNKVFTLENLRPTRSLDTLHVEEPTPLRYVYETPEGGILTKTLTFYPDQYQFGLTISLNHFQDVIANRRYQVTWNSGIAITEENVRDDLTYSKAYSLLANDLVDVDASKAKPGSPATESFEGDTRWVAVRNKYFTSIITPVSREAAGMQLVGTQIDRQAFQFKQYDASLVMPYQENDAQRDSFFVYVGPLDYNILTSYNRDFPRMMNFGWKIIRPISKGVLWAFTALHKFIPNYGLVLILFGVVVKILVFPLTKKSYVSMKEMQILQPKVQELRDKYKNDSQKMNEEMMKLYKEHGVNPMGGCLPMLLQMPLLYALFIVFRSTIELRGANFFWWIKDLSQPDTVFTLPFSLPLYGANVNILPLIMAVTMIVQQRMTSTGSSQQQKMMMWIMPIFFLLIFNNFPSGLNLYYALFNLMTIIQQKWFIDIPSGTPATK